MTRLIQDKPQSTTIIPLKAYRVTNCRLEAISQMFAAALKRKKSRSRMRDRSKPRHGISGPLQSGGVHAFTPKGAANLAVPSGNLPGDFLLRQDRMERRVETRLLPLKSRQVVDFPDIRVNNKDAKTPNSRQNEKQTKED